MYLFIFVDVRINFFTLADWNSYGVEIFGFVFFFPFGFFLFFSFVYLVRSEQTEVKPFSDQNRSPNEQKSSIISVEENVVHYKIWRRNEKYGANISSSGPKFYECNILDREL